MNESTGELIPVNCSVSENLKRDKKDSPVKHS